MKRRHFKPNVPLVDRFWARVSKGRGCWVWTGLTDTDGYGSIRYRGKLLKAHRLAWELANGPITPAEHVLHRCDTPGCVRVAHLFLGDQAVNMADMDAKGRRVTRAPKGSRHHAAILSESDVHQIRRQYRDERVTYVDLANRFGVSKITIGAVVRRQNWRHI